MKFKIVKNEKTESYNTFVLQGNYENEKEKEWSLERKVRRIKQLEKGSSVSGYVCFMGKSIDNLQRSPSIEILKTYKKNFQILWVTIMLFKRRF